MASVYQDVDLHFSTSPSTKDIGKIFDVTAAKFALRNLMLTAPGENLDNPLFGVGINAFQFELATPIFSVFVSRAIKIAVAQFLPEITLQDVSVSSDIDSNDLQITLTFFVIGVVAIQKIQMTLDRTR